MLHSTGQLLKHVNTEECSPTCSTFSENDSADKENATSEKSTKTKTLTSVAKLLQQKLIQKEEHEAKKQKRHDERMNIETKLVDTLTQFLNK